MSILINRKSLSFLFLLSLIAQSLLMSSCGYISIARKSYFEPETENVDVYISNTEDGPYTRVENPTDKRKLNHYQKKYFVKQEKDGHESEVTEINRSETNHLRRLDIFTAAMNSAVMSVMGLVKLYTVTRGSGATYPFPNEGLYAMIGVGLGSWAVALPSPARLYPKKIELPKLNPIFKKDTGQLFLASSEHKFKLDDKGIQVKDFETKEQYELGWGYEKRDTAEAFEFLEDLDLHKEVATILTDLEYGIDSAEATNTNALMVDSRVLYVTCGVSENELICKVKVSWALETKDRLQYVYDRTFTGESKWHPLNEDSMEEFDQQVIIKDAMTNALTNSLNKFLRLDTIQSILSAPAPIPLAEEEELTLNTGNVYCAKVSEAVKAVLTVVTSEGHGSGCIVTSDGYIVTNAHVVKDDTTNIEGILTEDTEIKVPLKFIRMNEAVDLALLKIDSTGFIPLKLGSSKEALTGADVYAIGTPADIELGQTLTRGIISGKRKFGGHSMIQTDVAINPGNSGGALILNNGVMIGIVTAELKNRRIDDIGFAIPAQLIENSLKIKLVE